VRLISFDLIEFINIPTNLVMVYLPNIFEFKYIYLYLNMSVAQFFRRKKCNTTCTFLVLENGIPHLNEDGDGDSEININMIEKWKNSKNFLSNYNMRLHKFILIAILDEQKVIIDIEKYNEFESEMGFEPNTFLNKKYTEIENSMQLNLSDNNIEYNSENSDTWEMSSLGDKYDTDTLFIFTKSNSTQFNYTYPLKYNSIIYEILDAINKEFFHDMVSAESKCVLTGHNERYNNCIFLTFDHY
jgi:hypothetical protein